MATIQEIIKNNYAAFERRYRIREHVRKAAAALKACRTSALGGHVQACPEGHYHRQWYNSCRNRVCPQCNGIKLEQWLQRQKDRLLNCGHYHMIFTIPHEFNEIWRFNMKQMTNVLFRAVRDTLFEFFPDEKHMGGKPGIIATLHTWSQTLIEHSHIHCLITEGGLSGDGRWIVMHNGYLLPVKAVMPVFRRKMLAYVDRAVDRQEIRLPGTMSLQRWRNLNNRLGRVKWNVRIQTRYEYGKGVLTYLARYIRGGAISNSRIIYEKDGEVKFRYRRGDNKHDTMQLPVDQFMKRYFSHVPEPYTRVVRYYGLYAPKGKEELEVCREQLGQGPVQESKEPDWQEYLEKRGIEEPVVCPKCGRKLVRLADIPRIRWPDKQAA